MLRRAWWTATREPDSDALASIDNHETMLWYVSRGDECTNCPAGAMGPTRMMYDPLWIRVNK